MSWAALSLRLRWPPVDFGTMKLILEQARWALGPHRPLRSTRLALALELKFSLCHHWQVHSLFLRLGHLHKELFCPPGFRLVAMTLHKLHQKFVLWVNLWCHIVSMAAPLARSLMTLFH